MGTKNNDLKELNCIINSLKSQLDSVNDREANTDDGKDSDSYDKEGNHEKIQSCNKGKS